MSGPVRPDDAVEAAAHSSASLKVALAHANGWELLEHRDVIAVAEPRRRRAVVTSATASREDVAGLVDAFFRVAGGSYRIEDPPEELGHFETVLVDAMPVTGVGPGRAGALWQPTVLDIDGLHLWLGFDEGTPVATACSWRRDHATGVYWVTVRSGWRGRGYGAAMTAAAIASDRPSVLASTSSGQPTYERLGFRTVGRSTRWQRD